jgi:hypothetical protein
VRIGLHLKWCTTGRMSHDIHTNGPSCFMDSTTCCTLFLARFRALHCTNFQLIINREAHVVVVQTTTVAVTYPDDKCFSPENWREELFAKSETVALAVALLIVVFLRTYGFAVSREPKSISSGRRDAESVPLQRNTNLYFNSRKKKRMGKLPRYKSGEISEKFHDIHSRTCTKNVNWSNSSDAVLSNESWRDDSRVFAVQSPINKCNKHIHQVW